MLGLQQNNLQKHALLETETSAFLLCLKALAPQWASICTRQASAGPSFCMGVIMDVCCSICRPIPGLGLPLIRPENPHEGMLGPYNVYSLQSGASWAGKRASQSTCRMARAAIAVASGSRPEGVLGPPARCPLTVSFLGEGSPAKNRLREKKGIPLF